MPLILNYASSLLKITFAAIAISSCLMAQTKPATSQILPEVWGSLGFKDDDLSYGAGVKWIGFGVEIGTGTQGATGGDVLGFIPLPFVSPYVGLGIYSGDDTIAYSGGVHISPPGHFFFGAGYHSIRGINGQLGIKF
jgi:hypothetical protein